MSRSIWRFEDPKRIPGRGIKDLKSPKVFRVFPTQKKILNSQDEGRYEILKILDPLRDLRGHLSSLFRRVNPPRDPRGGGVLAEPCEITTLAAELAILSCCFSRAR